MKSVAVQSIKFENHFKMLLNGGKVDVHCITESFVSKQKHGN